MKHYLYTFFLWDAVFLVFITALSLFHIQFFLKAQYINTTYPDWIVHAYRIKSLSSNGLLSWSHMWANGISLWKSYQFIPHFLTLGLIKLLHISVTRGMVIATIILFFLLRYFIYFFLRVLKYQPLTACISTILSFDIAQYWGGVNDYSLLFGFTFFPVILFLWVRYFKGSMTYLFPYIAGLTFYIHPILGYSSIGLWFLAIIFSDRKTFSFSHCIQFIIILCASSLWWFPLVSKTSFIYSNGNFQNKYFLGLVLASYQYLGLSLFLFICFGVSCVRMFMPIKKPFIWTRVLFVYACLYFILTVIGISLDLPKTLDALQYTRGMTLIGIAIIFVFTPVIEYISKITSVALRGGVVLVICLITIEGLWFTSIYSPTPSTLPLDAVSAYITQHPNKDITDGRIWTSTIGPSSYEDPSNIRFPYSYMGHLEPNQVSPRISPLILYFPYRDTVPMSNIERLNTYFKLSGVKYIFFEENSPFTKTILASKPAIYKDLGHITTPDTIYHGFQVPWDVRNAVLINDKDTSQMKTFPLNLELSDANDQLQLDNYAEAYTNIVYKSNNFSVPVTYTSQDSMQVVIPESRKSNLLYINESYDPNWKAYFHNKEVRILPSGPNFMVVNLGNQMESGIIVMKHFWPISFYVSLFLIFIIPLEILLLHTIYQLFFNIAWEKIL